MIAKLKKLEATDGSIGHAVSPELPHTPQSAAKPMGPSPELQMHAVPRNGWLSGPGRRFGEI